MSFNLNLLECKFIFFVSSSSTLTSFNLNLLECKSEKENIMNIMIEVLISTYWNVNISEHNSSVMFSTVLISTYWNVNIRKQIFLYVKRSF